MKISRCVSKEISYMIINVAFALFLVDICQRSLSLIS